MEILFYLIHIPLFAWVAWWLSRRDQEHPLRRYYWPVLGLKLAAAILIGILYSGVFNTTGDTYAYMIDGNAMFDIMRTDFSSFCKLYFSSEAVNEKWSLIIENEPRYWSFFRVIYPLNLLCGLQYWIITCWLSLFCFIQLYKLSAVILKHYSLSKSGVLFALLLMPSVVYWSAGLNKETVAVAAIAYVVRLMLNYLHEQKFPDWKQILVAVFFVVLLWLVKFYYAAVFLPCLIWLYVLYLKGRIRWVILGIFLLGFAIFFASFNLHLSPDQFANSIYLNYTQMIAGSVEGSYFTLPLLQPDLISIIKSFPAALWYGCFSPQLWQAHYFLAYLAALQNTVVLFLFFILLWKWKEWKWSREASVILVYSLVLAGLLAIASPNWGSLLRYKVSFEPYALLLLLGAHPWMKKLDVILFR